MSETDPLEQATSDERLLEILLNGGTATLREVEDLCALGSGAVAIPLPLIQRMANHAAEARAAAKVCTDKLLEETSKLNASRAEHELLMQLHENVCSALSASPSEVQALREALRAAEPFLQPEIARGPAILAWVVMMDLVGAALSSSQASTAPADQPRELECPVLCPKCETLLDVKLMVATTDGQVGAIVSVAPADQEGK